MIGRLLCRLGWHYWTAGGYFLDGNPRCKRWGCNTVGFDGSRKGLWR